MNTNQSNVGQGYWLAWFLASAMGYGMGGLLGIYFVYGFFNPLTSKLSSRWEP